MHTSDQHGCQRHEVCIKSALVGLRGAAHDLLGEVSLAHPRPPRVPCWCSHRCGRKAARHRRLRAIRSACVQPQRGSSQGCSAALGAECRGPPIRVMSSFRSRPQLPNDWSYTTLTSRRRLVRWTNSYSLGALVRNTHGGSEVFSVFLERSALHVLVLGLFRPAKAVPLCGAMSGGRPVEDHSQLCDGLVGVGQRCTR